MTEENQHKRVITVDPVAQGIRNRVAEGTVWKGDMECAGGLWVDGKIVGNVVVHGFLLMEVTGEIIGNVHVLGDCILLGSINPTQDGTPSEVVVEGIAEITETLRAKCNITAFALDWHHGAMVDGRVRTVKAANVDASLRAATAEAL